MNRTESWNDWRENWPVRRPVNIRCGGPRTLAEMHPNRCPFGHEGEQRTSEPKYYSVSVNESKDEPIGPPLSARMYKELFAVLIMNKGGLRFGINDEINDLLCKLDDNDTTNTRCCFDIVSECEHKPDLMIQLQQLSLSLARTHTEFLLQESDYEYVKHTLLFPVSTRTRASASKSV
jgi:hypothetical protein